MTVFTRIFSLLALVAITVALVGAVDPAFASIIAVGPVGAPGPIAGAGLSILAIGYGAYWIVKRYRKST
jgi:hypothetical protein